MEGSLEDNFRLMDRCSNSGASGQKRERVRRERVSRQKIKVREKGEKSQNTVFPMFCGPGGVEKSAR